MLIKKVQHYSPFRPLSPDDNQLLVVPQTARILYNISEDFKITSNSSVNVAEFTTNSFSKSDMSQFVKGCALQQPNDIKTIGPYNPSNPDTECTLDIQWITAIAANANNFYLTSSEWVLEMAQQLYGMSDMPLVTSISWASDERSSVSYDKQADVEFMKLGTRGGTILSASGDGGAEGTGCNSDAVFNPGYPGTSPYGVSVGATMLTGGGSGGSGMPPICSKNPVNMKCGSTNLVEDPADLPAGGYATGGGFSTYAAQPSFQADLVQDYINNSSIPKPPSSDFDKTNRGFPDIAAIGNNILIYGNGQWQLTGGTSAATPIIGAVIAILNDRLMNNGRHPLGFATPFLYQMATDEPDTFRGIGDLKTNNKDGCPYGYVSNPNPEPRWDPVNGLGVPNVGKMLDYIQSSFIPNVPAPRRKLF